MVNLVLFEPTPLSRRPRGAVAVRRSLVARKMPHCYPRLCRGTVDVAVEGFTASTAVIVPRSGAANLRKTPRGAFGEETIDEETIDRPELRRAPPPGFEHLIPRRPRVSRTVCVADTTSCRTGRHVRGHSSTSRLRPRSIALPHRTLNPGPCISACCATGPRSHQCCSATERGSQQRYTVPPCQSSASTRDFDRTVS